MTRGGVIAHELLGLGIERVRHLLVEPPARLLLDLVLALAAILGEHALRPAADVEHAELVLQIDRDPLEQIEIADLAELVAVLHQQRARVLGDQRLVHVEERTHAGTRADDGGFGHGEMLAP